MATMNRIRTSMSARSKVEVDGQMNFRTNIQLANLKNMKTPLVLARSEEYLLFSFSSLEGCTFSSDL